MEDNHSIEVHCTIAASQCCSHAAHSTELWSASRPRMILPTHQLTRSDHQIRAALAEETENRGADAVMFPSDHDTGILDLYAAVKFVRPGGCVINVRLWDDPVAPSGGDDMTEAGAHMQASIVNRLMHKDLRCKVPPGEPAFARISGRRGLRRVFHTDVL